MKLYRRKVLPSLLLAAAILACTGLPTLGIFGEDAPAVDDDVAALTVEDVLEEIDESTLATDADMLAKCKLYAENGDFQLYVNEDTAYFGVLVKSTGYVWWSSPINADKDPLAQGAQRNSMRSSLFIDSGDQVQHNSKKVTSYAGAVTRDGLTVEKLPDGVKFIFNMTQQEITIPLVIRLNETGFSAEVPVAEIKELKANAAEGGAEIITLSMLPSFGAASAMEEGYILVPDGSGALINFNNGKNTASIYKGAVYGRDYSISQLLAPAVTEQVYLPITGMVRKGTTGTDGTDNAMLAVAVAGDAVASVRASVSVQNITMYNNTWFDFQMRSTDEFFMGSQTRSLKAYESGKIRTGDIAVRYYLLSGEDLSFVDLADTYRNHLINEQGLTKKTKANDTPLYVTLHGGTMKQQSILGFPVDLQTTATTFDQALGIATELKNGGVDNLSLLYKDFTTSGIKDQVSTGVDYSGKLGGKKGYTKLNDFVSGFGSLYAGLGFEYYANSGNGYSMVMNGAKMLTKSVAVQSPFEMAFGTTQVFVKPARMILSPYYFGDVFDNLLKSLQKEQITTVTLDESSYILYSDFSRVNPNNRSYINRNDAKNITADGYKKLTDAGVNIVAQSSNAYLLPYVSAVTNVPLYSSNYDMFDEDVPFYQIVLHGYIPYSSTAVNATSSADNLLLNTVLTGSAAQFDMMAESPRGFSDSYYDELFYAKADGWTATAIAEYKLLKDTVSSLSDKKIIDYNILSRNERECVFEGGTTIYIDFATNAVKVDGKAIDISGYGIKGEADYVK